MRSCTEPQRSRLNKCFSNNWPPSNRIYRFEKSKKGVRRTLLFKNKFPFSNGNFYKICSCVWVHVASGAAVVPGLCGCTGICSTYRPKFPVNTWQHTEALSRNRINFIFCRLFPFIQLMSIVLFPKCFTVRVLRDGFVRNTRRLCLIELNLKTKVNSIARPLWIIHYLFIFNKFLKQ